MPAYRCRNEVHQELFHGECWHGRCPICKQGVTAFDFTKEDAEKMVQFHIEREHC
jgi:fructosamine-3-kinase